MDNLKRRVVVSAVIERDGKYLFTKQGNGNHIGLWAFPGGGLELEESSLINALRREVKEEVDIEIKDEKLLNAWVLLVPEDKLQLVAIFYKAKWASGEPKTSEEVADVKWLSLEELKAFPIDKIRPPTSWYGELLVKL